MLYIFGALVATLIVFGQALWKIGVKHTHFVLSKEFIFSQHFIRALLSPYILFGVLSYGCATLLFMSLLAKYQYTDLQAVVVSSSLIATFTVAVVYFGEKVSPVNLLGLLFLITGAILATRV